MEWKYKKPTDFQFKVYLALLKVKPGKTITYSELAKKAGFPGAARAVGTALAKNPFPIVVPCHRVIKADGSLGNYSAGGPEVKRYLIERERLACSTIKA